MSMILGMDPFVFTAWIGTIIGAAFCVFYGIYNEIIKKHKKNNKKTSVKEDK